MSSRRTSARKSGRSAWQWAAAAMVLGAAVGCGPSRAWVEPPPEENGRTSSESRLNLVAGSSVIYEAQVRTANACHPDVGAEWQKAACRTKVSPGVRHRPGAPLCWRDRELNAIRLGTLDDMLENSADRRSGITVRYVSERVGANTVWLMPVFPNNDTWSLPDACDNLGSPYAVRDYFHASGSLSRYCIQAGRDEYSSEPCWGTPSLEALIAQAHARGMRVMLDVAFNHFGHNYLMYDYVNAVSVRQRIDRGEPLERLWDFAGTDDWGLVHPELLDTPGKLEQLVGTNPQQRTLLNQLMGKCPGLNGDRLVRAFNTWREGFDFERARFNCQDLFLEFNAPGFYLGANGISPSKHLGDNFTRGWPDVKFLFHREQAAGHQWEFVRTREYLFRVLNYWVSRGVDGFRLDHTTDTDSGLSPNEWRYVLSKVDYYAGRRGQARPMYLAEEFHQQQGMSHVVDVMTEGYLHDINGRHGVTKDAPMLEALVSNMERFAGPAFTMTALETHDELRLLEGTGFNIWTGAGFWGLGATTRSTPMILMGQEFGESWRVGFRQSDFLRSRFEGTAQFNPAGDALSGYYRRLVGSRLDHRNRALLAPHSAYLRSRWTGQVDPRIFAQVKWSDDHNVVFVFHNLWEQPVQQSYFLPPQLATQLAIVDHQRYRLVDAISEQQMGPCRSGSELKWELYVDMDRWTRAQWLRLEQCN